MPIQLIATDIDGTLLDSKSQVSAANSQALAEAAARGIEIVLVTGRRFDFALPIALSLPCDLHMIVNNGALAKSRDGKTHLRYLLASATARRVLEATPEFRPHAAVVFDRPGARQVILEKVDWDDPFRGGYFRRNREYIAEVAPLPTCLNGEDPIQVMYTGQCVPMRAAMKSLAALPFAGEFTLALTEYENRDLSILDVLPRDVTKGTTLKEWVRRRGIPARNVMAIGDNWNDREMLEFAGHPVVMGNSVDELKSLGWPITLSNDEDGLAAAIRRYALDGTDHSGSI
ncbi:MAG: Cof-type HAD-IIB family hydrolase [Candidatus Acidiferrales bacterium]